MGSQRYPPATTVEFVVGGTPTWVEKTNGIKAVKNSVPVGTVLDSPLLLVMHVLRTMDIQFVTVAFA